MNNQEEERVPILKMTDNNSPANLLDWEKFKKEFYASENTIINEINILNKL